MELRAKHTNGEHSWGVDGETGKIMDEVVRTVRERECQGVLLWKHLFVVAVLTTGLSPDPQVGDRDLCLAICYI